MSTARVFGRIAAVLIMLGLMTVVPVLLLAENSQRVVTGAQFVDSLTADERLFEVVTELAAGDLARELPWDPATRDLPVAQLDAAEWNTVLRTVAPPAAVQGWTRDALNAGRQWARGGGAFLEEIVIPYGQMRDNLVNDPHQTVLRTLTEAQPACRPGQQPLAGAAVLIPACRPAAGSAEPFYADLASAWKEKPDEVWRQLWPAGHGLGSSGTRLDSADLSLAELIERESEGDWNDTRLGLRYAFWSWTAARAVLLIALMAGTLAALALVALLAARNGAEAVRWMGGALVLVALATAGLGLVVWLGGWWAPLFALGPSPDLDAEIAALLRPSLVAFGGGVGLAMAWQAGLMAVAGAVAWLISFLVPRPRPAVPAPAQASGGQYL